MQQFKIDNFLEQRPGEAFPKFESLTATQAGNVWQSWARVASQPSDSSQLIPWIEKRATPLLGVNIEGDEIPLSELFSMLGVEPANNLYVHWDGPLEIDRFTKADLEDRFYDIWYPSADDIEIFDDTFEWMVFVRHFGGVQLWRP